MSGSQGRKARKERISVQLDGGTVLLLQVLADASDRSVSAIVRDLVQSAEPYLKRAAVLAEQLQDADEDARNAASAYVLAVEPYMRRSLAAVEGTYEQLALGIEEAAK